MDADGALILLLKPTSTTLSVFLSTAKTEFAVGQFRAAEMMPLQDFRCPDPKNWDVCRG